MPASAMNSSERLHHEEKKEPLTKLVLCFDGTGNKYSGDTSDTNIVKLYQKLDREAENQFHYYQPGIGTYSAGEESLNAGLWGRFKRSISQVIDQAVGTTFDSHVIAGYRFVMRYYTEGSQIYLFGFSRGAFTARFLARMISTIGLLSKGNEEMVPFAYKSYQNYETGVESGKLMEDWMDRFSKTFCRPKMRVHFLGLFDTVNSVGVFDVPFTTKTHLPKVFETACHIRHAVAIDERRSKFRAALLQQDLENMPKDKAPGEDIKEVYFPGNHGDVGGGWLAEGDKGCSDKNPPVQLSDLSLEWMINELKQLPYENDAMRLVFNKDVDEFLNNIRNNEVEASTATIHDVLKFNGGVSAMKVILWNLLGESIEASDMGLTATSALSTNPLL
ncbi:hypothetical protein MMC29_004313 [Sticta canariensis]|nr:hypothetical protein [Sticta canariensis]